MFPSNHKNGEIFAIVFLLFLLALLGRLLLRLELVEQRVEAREVRVPDLAVVLDPRVRRLERFRFDPARSSLRVAAARDQSSTLEHLQMLRDRGLAHIERLSELVDRCLAESESGENRTPRWVGER